MTRGVFQFGVHWDGFVTFGKSVVDKVLSLRESSAAATWLKHSRSTREKVSAPSLRRGNRRGDGDAGSGKEAAIGTSGGRGVCALKENERTKMADFCGLAFCPTVPFSFGC